MALSDKDIISYMRRGLLVEMMAIKQFKSRSPRGATRVPCSGKRNDKI